jgi:small subunit ribosomal protein S3
MGHKVHPVGFRVGVIRGWDAKWYADKHYVNYLLEDLKVRNRIKSMYPEAGVSQVEIDRQANNVTLTIHTARPGILIGRGGQRVDEMRHMLERLIGKRIQLNIREVQQPELDAFLVARSVADQMERRVAYRRAMKQSMQRTIQAGAKGMRIRCAGRLDGAEIARKVIMHEGRVPLHTIRADVDYGFTEARTVMGRIGVKVWVYKGDILPEKEEEEAVAAPPTAVAEAAPASPPAAPEAAATTVVSPPAATPAEAPAAEAKPAEEQPAPAPAAPAPAAEEKPKPTRRVARPRAVETPAPAATAEEKPKTVRRATRPKPAAETPQATEATTEEKPKPATRRAPRAAAPKSKEVKPEETAEKPAAASEPADKQGEGNATT